MAPVFEGLATEYEGVASFVKVDIDDLPETFDGVSIPAFHVSHFVAHNVQYYQSTAFKSMSTKSYPV